MEINAENPIQETVLQSTDIPYDMNLSPCCVDETDACTEGLKNLEVVVGSKPSPKSVTYDGENVNASSSNGESYSGNRGIDGKDEIDIGNQHLSEVCDELASIGTQLFPKVAASETEYVSDMITPSATYGSFTPTTQETEIQISPQSVSALSQGPTFPIKPDNALESSTSSIKCSVIKGSSLVSTKTDIRQLLKVGGLLTIDGESCVASSSAAEWTVNTIALQRDWPVSILYRIFHPDHGSVEDSTTGDIKSCMRRITYAPFDSTIIHPFRVNR